MNKILNGQIKEILQNRMAMIETDSELNHLRILWVLVGPDVNVGDTGTLSYEIRAIGAWWEFYKNEYAQEK